MVGIIRQPRQGKNQYIDLKDIFYGQGMTPEEQSKLCVPFTRISQARVEGHGLGLSIVQRVINKESGFNNIPN
ncbi:ATP-binding protein [Candidatus Parabeggiatoa sp. HSG14]|uniref:ATP-binding protein n=1 Tax=Candidatus Parabeggiatoa sp. HSG14 TaxID=3055593 RepID=UPI0032E37B27